MPLTRNLANPLTSAIARGVGAGGNPAWASILNASLLKTAAYSTLIQRGRDGLKTNVLIIGDSIGFGYGSHATDNQMRMNGLGPLIASRLSAAGIRSRAQGFFGNGKINGTAFAYTYDSRITYAAKQGVTSLGGAAYQFDTAGHTVTFTPSENVDTFEIYYYRGGGLGTISRSVDGGAATNFSTAGATGLQTVTVSAGSLGAHSLTVAWISGTSYVLGFNAYNSAQQGLQFVNAAANGGKAQDFTTNDAPYRSLPIGTGYTPSATMIVLGANHWNNAESVATFTTDMQTLITAYAALGPVILVADLASNPATNAALAAQQPFVTAMRQLAATNGLLMFDLWTHFGGASSDFGANWKSDGIHPSPTGYGVAADLIANALATA